MSTTNGKPSLTAQRLQAAWKRPDSRSGARRLLAGLVEDATTPSSPDHETAKYDLLWLTYHCQFARLAHIGAAQLDPDEAEEIEAETIRKVLEGLDTYRGDSTFDGWVRGIAAHTAQQFLDAKRRARGERRAEPSEQEPTVDLRSPRPPDHAKISSMVADRLQVEEAFSRLTLKEQITLVLKGLPMTAVEIASYLKEPESTVRSRITRAEKKLRPDLTR